MIKARAEAVSVDICDARDYATAEAKAKLEVILKPVLEAVVVDYEKNCGGYTLPTQDLIPKVYKSTLTTYINCEQKVAKTYDEGKECYYALVTSSLKSERLVMAMERYLLPKAGENRRGHEKKIKQLRQVIVRQFDAYNQPFSDDGDHVRQSRKLANKR